MKDIHVILASSSPRRREILETLGIPFAVVTPDADERVFGAPTPEDFVQTVSARKCDAACALEKYDAGTLVIGCDTVVVADGKILGKPRDAMDAVRTLRLLSGKSHAVLSGLSLSYFGENGHFAVGVCRTDVRFRTLSDEEIEAYVRSGEPMGKAGSYAIQMQGASFVEQIAGDYYNIVGFPVSLFFRMAREEFSILPTDLMQYGGTKC